MRATITLHQTIKIETSIRKVRDEDIQYDCLYIIITDEDDNKTEVSIFAKDIDKDQLNMINQGEKK